MEGQEEEGERRAREEKGEGEGEGEGEEEEKGRKGQVYEGMPEEIRNSKFLPSIFSTVRRINETLGLYFT